MKIRPGIHASLSFTLLVGTLSAPAYAHLERLAFFPQDRVSAQPVYRPLFNAQGQATPQSPRLVVCKKPGNEGVAAGRDSRSLIEAMPAGALKNVNLQLLGECQYEHLQQAVNAVTARGTTLYILPGTYREEPSIRAREQNAGAADPADKDFCAAVLARGEDNLSYEEQYRCRFIQNTVAIFGDQNFADDNCGDSIQGVCSNPETVACNPSTSACVYYDLQLEGTGARNSDVVFEGTFVNAPDQPEDGQFAYLNGIRGDRTDGIYFRNFTAQIYEFNAIYVLETDGYVFDRMLTRWNDEYGFLSFASDHGLYESCEGYGNADSALYPGSASNIYEGKTHAESNLRARQSTEIRNSYAHHNALGYSGTAGNAGWVHDNVFTKNTTGMATESIFPDHPGMPQDHTLWEHNQINNNNEDYYRYVAEDGPCNTLSPRDRGLIPYDLSKLHEFEDLPAEVKTALLDKHVVCPLIPFPLGTALVIGGGNYDVLHENQVFDNWARAVFLLSVEATFRNENDPAKTFDTSHFNRFTGNRLAENSQFAPPRVQPNGTDFWWDGAGIGNCWDANTSANGDVSTNPPNDVNGLPGGPCPDGPQPTTEEATPFANNTQAIVLAPCLEYNRDEPATKDSGACDFFTLPPEPAGRQGSRRALASQPPQVQIKTGSSGKTGYFVLDNDSGTTQQVTAITIAAEGKPELLSGLKLKVNGVEATLDEVGASNTFTFDTPVELRLLASTLFELEASAKSFKSQLAALAPASGALTGIVLLSIGGLQRRSRRWLLLAIVCTSLLTACGRSGSSAPKGNVSFKLTAIEVQGDPGMPYEGLPLAIGYADVGS